MILCDTDYVGVLMYTMWSTCTGWLYTGLTVYSTAKSRETSYWFRWQCELIILHFRICIVFDCCLHTGAGR